MNKSKNKLYDNKDLLIESNQNEIFYPNIAYSESSELNKQNKKRFYYLPIATNESLKGNPIIYLATEDNDNTKNNNNLEKYINNTINKNKTKKNNLMNLKKVIKNKNKENKQNKENIDNKENIQPNLKNMNKKYIRKIIKKIIAKRPKKVEKREKNEFIYHSHSVDNYVDINNSIISNFPKNLENSHILDENFIKGMKNLNRKKNLLNAIEKYKRFKSFGKLNISINNYLNNTYSNVNSNSVSNTNDSINNNQYNKESKTNNTEKNNTEKNKLNNYHKNNSKIIEEENESESEMEKRNKIKEIKIIKIDNINIDNNNNNNNNNISLTEKNLTTKNKNKNKNILNNNYINNDKKYYLRNKKNEMKKNSLTNVFINPPKIIVKRILREERYIIDENGEEKLLGITQSFLPKNINIKKLDKRSNINVKSAKTTNNINNKNNINNTSKNDEEKIKKEKYKNNNFIICNKELIKTNSHNLFNEHMRKSLNNMYSYTNKSIDINKNILDSLKQKEKPITIKRYQNKIEKKYLLKFNEINKIRNNKNHIYHEIKSFSGEKQKQKEKQIIKEKIKEKEKEKDKPIKHIYFTNEKNKKKLNVNNSYREIKNTKKSYTLSNYKIKEKKNIFFNKKDNDKDNDNDNDSNNHKPERQISNYSFHESKQNIKIEYHENKRKNYSLKYFKPYDETIKNLNSFYNKTSS